MFFSLAALRLLMTMLCCFGLWLAGCAPVEIKVAPKDTTKDISIATKPETLTKRAIFENESRSRDVEKMADWIVDSGDNKGLPFIIIDKVEAKIFVFNADGRLRGKAPVLLGLARGDHSVPGIGTRKLSSIRPEERTTPAGRFVAALGKNAKGREILWVDYDGALSLHRVIPAKARLQRLSTPTPNDNRISYGCINVPVNFYDNIVRPAFTGTRGVVYILPEIRGKKEIFQSYYDTKPPAKNP